ncbi:hypothetical protein GGR57DRAFT_504919 [Xylariaceae sp. FL1272]|nr:hypothetical protein GGR57DRAFT_504919 [Xylariaceae sp. FL1272]
MRASAALLAFVGTLVNARTISPRSTVSKVFELDQNPSWLENLAISENGDIFATRIDAPDIWKIDPRKGTGLKLAEIPQLTSLTGIVEIRPSEFVVLGLNLNADSSPVAGSSQAWKLDVHGCSPHLELITTIPEATWVNGAAKVNDQTILITDSAKGVIYKLDLTTNDVDIALSDPETMTIPENATLQFGVNGIKTTKNHVYYTNTAREYFCRIPIDGQLNATGPAEIIASGFVADDFALLSDGTAYIATGTENTIIKVDPKGKVSVAAGSANSVDIPAATSVQLGRTHADRNTLYVTNSGDQLGPVNGTIVLPASVVAVRL